MNSINMLVLSVTTVYHSIFTSIKCILQNEKLCGLKQENSRLQTLAPVTGSMHDGES